ncbi:flocculation protein FLO11-like [Elysia marginata]|uniref:Centrosomal protein kizuna n=1 Tax=Elysia marginata TaxID=1093978 RepID=A0AAV4F7T3_9GAST|nr:flocculation protein FLO11-like [Elysia marginata]
MASSNVPYYEKQKDLQETITNCEQRRMELEKQFRLALLADQTSSKMKATRLNAYWRKICEDERRAKQRNEMMIREFERIDAHMAEMNARTQRLALVKKQYEDYISRRYPQWNEFMHGSPSQQQQEMQQPQTPRQQSKKQQMQQSKLAEDEVSAKPHQTTAASHQQQDQKQSQPKQQQQQQKIPMQQQMQHQQVQQHEPQPQQPIQSPKNISSQHKSQKDRPDLYQNIAISPQSSSVAPESENGGSEYANLPGPAAQQTSQVLPTRNEVPSEPQIQHHTHAVEVHHHAQADNGISHKDEEEEETSEFGSDTDIPMGQSLGNTQVRVETQSAQLTEDSKGTSNVSGSIKAELSAEGLFLLLRHVETDVKEAFSLEGYYRSSWPDASTKSNIIRAANEGKDLNRVDANLVSMVVLEQITLIVRNLAEKSLLPLALLDGTITMLSADKLRQHLSPEAQVIWDALFSHFVTLVRANVMEPHELSAIFTPCMVADGRAQEKGHTFIVHLLEQIHGDERTDAPSAQQRVSQWSKGISPKSTLEGSGSFVEDGRVPPLKFGSLLDKPVSDDESSYINSSLPRDAVPLNETAAYKNMISGTASQAPLRQQSSGPEDTDDDVEKQVATAIATQPVAPITPRARNIEDHSETSSQTATVHTPSRVYVPTAMETRQLPQNPLQSSQNKFQGVKISSDLDTDTEVDAGIFGSSRKQSDNFDFDFYD